jgi:DNA-binding MarR family transcriptional regulator
MIDTTTYLLASAHRANLARLGPRLAELDLHPGADVALAEIHRSDGVALGELARRIGVTPPSVTKMVKRLERKGLIERRGDPEDARVSRMHATTDGARVARAVDQAWRAVERDMLAPLSAHDAAALHALLARMTRRGGRARLSEQGRPNAQRGDVRLSRRRGKRSR